MSFGNDYVVDVRQKRRPVLEEAGDRGDEVARGMGTALGLLYPRGLVRAACRKLLDTSPSRKFTLKNKGWPHNYLCFNM